MTTLNFAPHYEAWLRDGTKTTTLRLGHRLEPRAGQIVDITVGHPESEQQCIGQARVIQVRYLSVDSLTEDDLKGESPDCRSLESARRVLSEIYARELEPHEALTLIRFQAL